MQEVMYTEAFNTLKPESCLFIISRDHNDKPNIMTCGWSMKCSHEPPLFAVAVAHKQYTNKLIRETKEFVVSVPNKKMEKYIELFGSSHGDKADKITESKIETVPGKHVKCPLLKEATINMECVLHKEIDVGDHTLFVGRIVAAYMNHGQKVLMSIKGSHGHRLYEEF